MVLTALTRPPNPQRNGQRKADENDNPTKRPSLFESRSRVSQTGQYIALDRGGITVNVANSGNREEIFLGPKLSFANASAARQASKTSSTRDRSPNEDTRRKGERNGVRDRSKDRQRHANGQHEDGRTRLRTRRDSDGDKDRPFPKLRSGPLGDEELEGDAATPKRGAFAREKFVQPWFREQKEKVLDDPKEDRRTSWRDKDRRPTREGDDEGFDMHLTWKRSSKPSEPEPHSQQDLAAFLKDMKAKDGALKETPASTVHEPEASMNFDDNFQKETAQIADEMPLFGLLGDTKLETKRIGEEGVSKKAEQPKVSRFFGPSTVSHQSQAPPPQRPADIDQAHIRASHDPKSPANQAHVAAPAPARVPAPEDRLGFDRMMQMLHLQKAPDSAVHSNVSGPQHPPRPPSHEAHQRAFPAPASPRPQSPQSRPVHYDSSHQSPPFLGDQAIRSPHPRRLEEQPLERPEKSADNKFLYDLMKPAKPTGSPSVDAMIYGRSYAQHRQGPSELPQLPANNMVHQQQKMPGPPPGLSDNQRAFAANQGMDFQTMINPRYRGLPPGTLEDMPRHNPQQLQDMQTHRHISPQEQRFPQPPQSPQHPPGPSHGHHPRMSSQDNINVNAPPGLRTGRPMPSMPHPQMPLQQPGLPPKQPINFPMQPGHHQPNHPIHAQPPPYIQQQMQQQHHNMRGPPPHGPPPGFMNGAGMPGMQPPGLGARRPPDQHMQQMMPPMRSPPGMQMMSPGFPNGGMR